MCTKIYIDMLLRYLKHIILLSLKMINKFIIGLLSRNHRKCLCMFVFMTVIIVYLLLNYNEINKINSKKQSSVNPTIVWWTGNFPGTKETKVCSKNVVCDIITKSDDSEVEHSNIDAYLFYGSQIQIENLPHRRQTDIWALYHEESPRNLEELMHEPMLNLFNFSATFSRYSDLPFPLQYLESLEDITSTKFFVPTLEKNKHLDEIAPVMYLQTDCETSTERDVYVKELMKYIRVDSYGACLNNKPIPKKFTEDYLNNLNANEFLSFVARYKFVVAIENGVCDDYITEKFWRPIKVGSVPIYFGSPSIRHWLPNEKSAILLEDFPTPEILSQHIKKLLDNDTLYEEYLEHKTKQIITNTGLVNEKLKRPYQNDGLVLVEMFECLVCAKVHNKSNIGINIVNKTHYNCPKPVSALTLSVNPSNHWVQSWEYAKRRAENINKMLTYI